MKRILLLFLPLLAASCGQVKQQQSEPAPVNVMSFNIRYDNPEDSLDNWKYRKDRAANAIRFYDADIVGTQEVLHNQLEDLKQRLPEYGVIGVGREDGKEKGEYSALWYKKERFTLLDSGYFWLSETPEVAGSKGWDGACERIASWAKLQDMVSGKAYFALNTHLDHVGVVARREGVSLILDKVNELSNGAPRNCYRRLQLGTRIGCDCPYHRYDQSGALGRRTPDIFHRLRPCLEFPRFRKDSLRKTGIDRLCIRAQRT